jgi:WD40 repeat protein
MLEGHSDSVKSMAFSPDGKQVVSGSDDKTVRLWDTVTGVALKTLEGHSHYVNSVAFSPDGKLQPALCVLGDWVVEGYANILLLPYDYRSPSCVANCNRTLVLGYYSGTILFLRFKQGLKVII